MHQLSKVRLMEFRQCPKKMWFSIHHFDRAKFSNAMTQSFATAKAVEELVRRNYDFHGIGHVLKQTLAGAGSSIKDTKPLLKINEPIFKGAFADGEVYAVVDMMLPLSGKQLGWHMIEVKASDRIKPDHLMDVSIQAYLARQNGVHLRKVSIAHIDASWTYLGDQDYSWFLNQEDVTEATIERTDEVKKLIKEAQEVVEYSYFPDTKPSAHCFTPYPCQYHAYCTRKQKQPEFPITWISEVRTKKLKEYVAHHRNDEIWTVPNELLNPLQKRIKDCTTNGYSIQRLNASSKELRAIGLPAYFLDFKVVRFTIPVWPDTRPFEPLPFQCSLHRMSKNGDLDHEDAIELTNENPRVALAGALLMMLWEKHPIFVYDIRFARPIIRQLAECNPILKEKLPAIEERLVDLRALVRKHYYHPDTTEEKRSTLKEALLCYGKLETLSMVDIWKTLAKYDR